MKKLTILFSSMAMLFGVGLGVGAAVKGEAKVEKAEAATVTYYFVPNSNWVKDSATFKIDFRDASGGWLNKRYSMTKASYTTIDDRDVYTYTCDITSGTVYFARFSSNGNDEWNYSGKCSIGDNKYYIDGTTNYDDQVINPVDRLPDRIVDSVGATSDTGRVFINNAGSGWTDGNVGVRVWGGSASSSTGKRYDATIYCSTWFKDKEDDNNTWYGYADIPLNATGFAFVKLSAKSTSATIWNYQNGNGYTVEDNCFAKIYYISNGHQSSADVSTGGAKNDKAYASLLSTFIQAYDTCSSSAKNGYGAYSTLNTNIFSHAQSGQTSTSVVSLNGVSKTIAQHIAGMQERSAASLSSNIRPSVLGNETATNATLATVIITVVSLAAVGGFFFLRKKKLSK